MASLQQDPSGVFPICFRYGKQRFKRPLQTTDHRKAASANRNGVEASAVHGEL